MQNSADPLAMLGLSSEQSRIFQAQLQAFRQQQQQQQQLPQQQLSQLLQNQFLQNNRQISNDSMSPLRGVQGGVMVSPLFQCNVSVSFYATLLAELKTAAKQIDQSKESSRELVWSFLFTMIGYYERQSCSNHFSPIINSWIQSPSVNLVAIELLYLSFAYAAMKSPDLFTKASLSTTEHNHNATIKTDISDKIPSSPSRPLVGSSSLPTPTKTNEMNNHQSPLFSAGATPIDVNNPGTIQIMLAYLQVLQRSASFLDQLHPEVKELFWKTAKQQPLEGYDESSFTRTVDNWTKDPIPHINSITTFGSTLVLLSKLGIIPNIGE